MREDGPAGPAFTDPVKYRRLAAALREQVTGGTYRPVTGCRPSPS